MISSHVANGCAVRTNEEHPRDSARAQTGAIHSASQFSCIHIIVQDSCHPHALEPFPVSFPLSSSPPYLVISCALRRVSDLAAAQHERYCVIGLAPFLPHQSAAPRTIASSPHTTPHPIPISSIKSQSQAVSYHSEYRIISLFSIILHYLCNPPARTEVQAP